MKINKEPCVVLICIIAVGIFLGYIRYIPYTCVCPLKVCNGERTFNKLPTEDAETGAEFHKLVAEQVTPVDPGLVTLVKVMIEPPSDNPVIKVSERKVVETPQATTVKELFKKPGFFVECGAYDGETASNTIYLEQKLGWTGLLVEVDPYLYTQLKGKNRRAHSLNAGLSIQNRATEMLFEESTGQLGKLIPGATNNSRFKSPKSQARYAPCVPLETMLLAMDVKRVDYLSLDVEGFELEVLKSVPFERVDISVLSVEYRHISGGKDALKSFMEENGYVMYKDIHFDDTQTEIFVEDFIFVKKTVIEK